MTVLTKVFELYDSVKEYLDEEHSFSINETMLNRIIKTEECFWSRLQSHGVEKVQLFLTDGDMRINGDFVHNNISGSFTLSFALDHIEWTRGHHALYLKLINRDIVLNKNKSGAMASAFNAISKGVFGKDLFGEKIDSFFSDGVAEINFNHLKPEWDILWSLIDVHSIHAVDSSLRIIVTFCLEVIKKRPAEFMVILTAIKDMFDERVETMHASSDV